MFEETETKKKGKGGKIIAGLIISSLPFLFILFIVLVSAVGISSTENTQKSNSIGNITGVSQNVLRYKEDVEKELGKYGLTKYTNLVLAIMQQESGGNVPDVMQSSESIGLAPNAITDPLYSIEIGVRYIASLETRRAKLGADLDTLTQSYNFGAGFMNYVHSNGKQFSTELAEQFSALQAQRAGWSKYGDVKYVAHVKRYLTAIENGQNGSGSDFIQVNGTFGQPLADPMYRSKVNVHFGRITIGGAHRGTDFRYPAGTPVYAVVGGTVTASPHYSWGNNVLIKSGNVTFRYAHLSAFAVQSGQTVKAGQVVGYVGTTGTSTGNHLHLEMTVDGKLVNCLNYLP